MMETQTVQLAPESLAPLLLALQWLFVALCANVFFSAVGALQRWKGGD